MSAPKLTRILYAEDDSMIRELVMTIMDTMTDFECVICKNGLDAIESACQTPFDLILLDVIMPVMDGLTALQKLRKDPATEHIPVVLMTGKVQTHEIEEYQASGAAGLIFKPFDAVTLPESINSIWDAIHDPEKDDWPVISVK